MNSVNAAIRIELNLSVTEQQGTDFFSVEGSFRLLQVLEEWIPGIVNFFRYLRVSVIPRFHLRLVSLYKNIRVCFVIIRESV
jgi:hypothetical protein